MTAKGRRKILWAVGLMIGGLLLLGFGCPLWFPWVLRPLAGKQGVGYTRYERIGYTRFAVAGLGFTNQSIQLRAARVEAFVPSVWLWRLVRKDVGQRYFTTANWELESLPTGGPSTPVYEQALKLQQTVNTLERWIPTAALSNGMIRVDHKTVRIDAANWTQGKLSASARLPGDQAADANLDFARKPQTFELVLGALELKTDASILLTQTGLGIKGEGAWRGNHFELQGTFGPGDSLPRKAHFEARSFTFPAQALHLPAYREIDGSLSIDWEQGAFGLDLALNAKPSEQNTYLQPLQASLHSHGDTNSAVINSARVTGPWVELDLSRDLQVYFAGPLLRQPGSLNMTADLNRQPWVPLKGKLVGSLDFTPTNERLPDVGFRLQGSNIVSAVASADTLKVTGTLKWPWLELETAEATFTDNSKGSLQAKVDLENDYMSEGQFAFQGGLPRKWLPAGFSFAELTAHGAVHGALAGLKHSGHAEVQDFLAPGLQPLRLGLDWDGEQTNVLHGNFTASSGSSALSARIGISNQLNLTELELTQLAIKTNEQTLFEQKEPSRMAFERSSNRAQWRLNMTPLQLAGPVGRLDINGNVAWPNQAMVQISAQDLNSAVLTPFLQGPTPNLTVKRLSTWAHWTNGPMSFGALLSASGTPPTETRLPTVVSNTLSTNLLVDLELSAGGNEAGLVLSNLEVTSQGSSVLAAHGFLPMVLTPAARTNSVTFQAERSLFFNAAVQPQAFFWRVFSNWSGLGLVEPYLDLNVSGTWPAPEGNIGLSAQRVELKSKNWRFPKMENLQLNLLMDRHVARLTKGSLLVQGQPVTLSGELPLGEQAWRELKRKALPSWSNAKAQLEIKNAQLAPFEHLLPEVLAPEGELNLELSLQPGAKVRGKLWLRDARTKPLANAGPLRNIEVRMTLGDGLLNLDGAAARVGGANVVLTGIADLRGTNWWAGELPPFSLSLRGLNVPLSRQPDSIIRADLLLGLLKTNGAPPTISGVAQLRDSFYLSELSSLVPGGIASPSRRPPYFSIDTPSLADWRLAVRVQGTRFLNVSSPLFTGEVSANLRVQGTLKEPLALGDLRIDSGVVHFPFGNLQVQQGLVNLTSDEPYHPQLFVNAASKQYGYDIRMEVTGPVDAPVLQFTSTPPLSSQQILLMVTAGELPHGQYTLTSQQKAETAAVFLGQDVLSKIGIGDSTQQRITVQSGQEISEQGRPTYHVEFKLTDDWSLEGEYDRFGDFNAGVKWRVYSK